MAEWTTLIVSSMVVALVVGLIGVQMLSVAETADPVVRVVEIDRVGDRFGVRVTVENGGDETAANVQVAARLASGAGSQEAGDLSIDFLAGGEAQDLVFLFDADPAQGELEVVVTGFEDP